MSGLLAHQTMLDTAGGVQLVDEVIERYVAWREERDAVRAGYEAWSSGAEEERTIRFAVYNEAVDREVRRQPLRGEHRAAPPLSLIASRAVVTTHALRLGFSIPGRGGAVGLAPERARMLFAHVGACCQTS